MSWREQTDQLGSLLVIIHFTSRKGKEWLDLWELEIQVVLYLLQRNKGVYHLCMFFI